jgi:hydrogenase maturation protease
MHLLRDPFPESDGEATLKEARVVGLGSPFGDDQVGWRVVEALRQAISGTEIEGGCSLAACDRPGPGLLSLMEGAQAVWLVDAVLAGGKPGSIYRLDAREAARVEGSWSGHGLGVASALALGWALGGLPEQVVIYGIEAGAATPIPDGDLSPEVQGVVTPVARALMEELRAFLSAAPAALRTEHGGDGK